MTTKEDFNQQGSISASALIAMAMSLAFVAALSFGVWAFSGKQESESNLAAKIAVAVDVAVEETSTEKDSEFADIQKSPFKKYMGSSTYGSLSFEFPKSWSVYAVNKTSGTLLDFYAHPGVVPGTGKDVLFAFRSQILNSSYEKELAKFKSKIKKGSVTATAYRPALMPAELGVLLTGEIETGKQGLLVLLPQRDKTFRLWTESSEYTSDFSSIIDTIRYIP